MTIISVSVCLLIITSVLASAGVVGAARLSGRHYNKYVNEPWEEVIFDKEMQRTNNKQWNCLCDAYKNAAIALNDDLWPIGIMRQTIPSYVRGIVDTELKKALGA